MPKYFPFFLVLLLAIALGSGCGGGRTTLDSTEHVTLSFNLSPDLPVVTPAVTVPAGYHTRSASWQIPWNELHISLIDMETGLPIEPAWHSLQGDKLTVTGPFTGKRLKMKISNRGDVIRQVVPSTEDQEIPEFPRLLQFELLLGMIPSPGGVTMTGFPTIGEAEIMASAGLLNWNSETPRITDQGVITPGTVDYINFQGNASDHPVKHHALQLLDAIRTGKFDDKINALSTLPQAVAIRKLFTGFAIEQENKVLTAEDMRGILATTAVTPVIESVSPQAVLLDDIATTSFTVTGKNFTSGGGTITASLGDTAGTIISQSDSVLTIQFPDVSEAGSFAISIAREVPATAGNFLASDASTTGTSTEKVTISE